MKHTLVAAFDNLGAAQRAKSELLLRHAIESNVQLSSAETDATAASSASASTPVTGSHTHDDESLGHKISHFFSHLFSDDNDEKSRRYAVAYPEAYRRGATVLTVTLETDEQADEAEKILQSAGAIDIDERSAAWEAEGGEYAHGLAGTTHIAGTHLGADRTDEVDRQIDTRAGETAIPVIEEDLRVGKREVNTGRVRVVSRVSERPVQETVNLHEEHAHIERRPVDRPAAAGELNSFKAGSIEIQETAEELVVEKSARVVEEVSVGKQSSDHQETVRDTVRRTDVEVQTEPGSATHHETLVKGADAPFKDR